MLLKFEDLPPIPRVSAIEGSPLKCVIFYLMVYETRYNRTFCVSQRQLLGFFNHSKRDVIGHYLKEFQSKRFFKKTYFSRKDRPDEYQRGSYFDGRSREIMRINQMADSLWNEKNGLLRLWPHTTAWGHGCLSPAGIFILAVLQRLYEEVSQDQLYNYLKPLVSEKSFEKQIGVLKKEKLIMQTPWGISVFPGWDRRLGDLLHRKPECCPRQLSGDLRRAEETRMNRERVARGIITHAERKLLGDLPCVLCRLELEPREEMEHFPPKKFLRLAGASTENHIALVWSIHSKCNGLEKLFIRSLPRIVVKPGILYLKEGTNLMGTYKASANFHLERFQKAFQAGDFEAAMTAITFALSLWLAIENSQIEYVGTTKRQVNTRIRTSRKSNCVTTEMCQLDF